jgi:hypothetical protein
LYYLCYKDMIIETITKVKFFKYYWNSFIHGTLNNFR